MGARIALENGRSLGHNIHYCNVHSCNNRRNKKQKRLMIMKEKINKGVESITYIVALVALPWMKMSKKVLDAGVCSVCGCTENNACVDSDYGACW